MYRFLCMNCMCYKLKQNSMRNFKLRVYLGGAFHVFSSNFPNLKPQAIYLLATLQLKFGFGKRVTFVYCLISQTLHEYFINGFFLTINSI